MRFLTVTLIFQLLFIGKVVADDPMNVGVTPVSQPQESTPKQETQEIDKNSPEYKGSFAGGCTGALLGLEAHFKTKAPANICDDPAKFEAWKKQLEQKAEARRKAELERKRAQARRPAPPKPPEVAEAPKVREEVVKVKIVPEVTGLQIGEGGGKFSPPSTRLQRREQGLWDGSVDLGTKAMPGAVAFLVGAEINLPFHNDKWFDLRYMVGNAIVDKRESTVNRFASDFLAAVRFRNNMSGGLSLTWSGKPGRRTTHFLAGLTGAYQWNMGRFSLRPEITVGYNGSKIRSIGDGLRAAGGVVFAFRPL